MVKSAVRFCGASDAELCHLDGERLKVAAHYGPIPGPVGRLIPVSGSVAGRAVLERQTVHVADLQAEAEEFPVGSSLAREFGYRTALVVPLLRQGAAVGTINLRRTELNPFADKQIALLRTFADQAVIAIENVRLFNELQERTAALTRSVGQLTALGEVGQAVSSSLELSTVLTTIVARAAQLCGAVGGAIYEYDEPAEEFQLRAIEGLSEEYLELARQTPQRKGEGATGRLAITPEPIERIIQKGAYRHDALLAEVRCLVGAAVGLRRGARAERS